MKKYLSIIVLMSFAIGASVCMGAEYAADMGSKKEGKSSEMKRGVATKKKMKKFSRNYGMAGCGLGSIVIGKKGGQIFAATTNPTFWSQYFGITVGTSNCEDEPKNEVASRIDHFVFTNKGALASDIARGGGDTLAGLSQLMGCQSSPQELGSVMQKNFRQIFPNPQVQTNEITDAIVTTVLSDEGSALVCSKVST